MLSWVQSSYNNYWESQSYSGENEGNSEQAKVLCGQEEEAFRIWSWGSCVPPSNTDGRNTKGYQIKKVNSEVCCALSDTEKDWCYSLWIALPPHLANLHVFHVSQLRKYIADPSHVLESDDIHIREELTVNAGPVRILDSQVKKLRGNEIKTLKVLWDAITQEMTWEMEDSMRQSYPHFFPGKCNFRGRKSLKVGGM